MKYRIPTAILLAGFLLIFLQIRAAAQDEDPVAAFTQAQDLHEKGDLGGAIKLYEKALKIEPAFPEAQYQMGMAQLALGHKTEAESAFRRAVELRADWTLALTSLGSLLIDTGKPDEAEKMLGKAVEIEPQNAVALSALTELRVNRKAPATSLEELLAKVSALASKANSTTSLWTAKAALENALNRRAAAKTSVLRALSTDPANRTALFLLGDIAVAEGDLDKAKDAVAKLDSKPSDQVRLLKANIFAAEGRADEALKMLDSIEKPGAAASELRGRINTSRTANSADLEKLLETSPNDAAILGRLCNLLRRDDPQKALDYCRRASAAEPSNASHAIGFGAALVQAKQYEAAVGIFRKIIEIVPDNFTARANLATALFQLKRFPEAKTEFEWLVQAQPRSPGAYLFLGIIHDEAGEYFEAMANYQEYLRLADPVVSKLDIEKVNLRIPPLQKLLKDGKGKKN